jgi:muconate cycloisomerase
VKISSVQTCIIQLPTRREHNWASKMRSPIGRHAIVRITTDEGVEGWGEAPAGATWGGAAMRYYGETPETVRHLIEEYLAPVLIGRDPSDIGVIHRRMDEAVKGHPYAKAALDIACYDATGKALGVAVSTLLGGRHAPGIEVAHSLGIMPIERCLDEAAQALAEGVRTIKCKTGLDPARDVALVAELRKMAGPDVKIRVDANEGYRSVAEAVRTTRAQEEHGLFLCEQPLAGARALAKVAARVDSPVMADESAWTVEDVLELHELGAASCISCYVTKPGGLFRARQQAELAQRLGIACDIGGSIETGIGNAANLALGTALADVLPSVCPVSKPAGGAGPSVAGIYYADDLVCEPFTFSDGHVLAPTGPGLGIEVDTEKIERYRV